MPVLAPPEGGLAGNFSSHRVLAAPQALHGLTRKRLLMSTPEGRPSLDGGRCRRAFSHGQREWRIEDDGKAFLEGDSWTGPVGSHRKDLEGQAVESRT